MAISSSEESDADQRPKVLIIGAGITGLVLAQAFKKHSISFTIFEADPNVGHRGRGWGLTIHWSLSTFIELLPQHLVERLPETYVDPEASKRGENGNFLFFDLKTGEEKYRVPPNQRIRVSRERLRALLLAGLDVQWSRTLTSFEKSPGCQFIDAHFSHGPSETGTLLIGADGYHSRTRRLLVPGPALATNHTLPIRLLGVSVIYPTSFAKKMRDLDPFFFQGGDPSTDAYMWFSFLDTPANNTRAEGDKESYECQILVSWPYRAGFLGLDDPLEVPESNIERVKLMKQISSGWTSPFKECVAAIPEDTECKIIALEDFVPKKGAWDNYEGRVTLIGDAAHAMTMFRGEAANHGITDIQALLSNLLPIWKSSPSSSPTAPTPHQQAEAINRYEEEMIARTAPAVLTSRRACMDAHEYAKIDDRSPLVSRRAMVFEE